MNQKRIAGILLSSFATLSFLSFPAMAETHEIKIADQPGLSYLPLMIIQDQHLLEKHAREAGLGDVKVSWIKFDGARSMNEALMSGGIDVASGGLPSLITLWDKTHGHSVAIKGIGALCAMPNYLVTNKPDVHSLKDFGPQDKIAVTQARQSSQAIMLEMVAAREFGEKNYSRMDAQTVTISHPNATKLMTSDHSSIAAHFSAPPFQEAELATPGVHKIANSYDVQGYKATTILAWTTNRFHDQNPKTYAALVAALTEADRWIATHKRDAARTYRRIAGDGLSEEALVRILSEKDSEFTMTPRGIMKTASFLNRVGVVKSKPGTWEDLFFSNVHGFRGN